MDEWEVYCLTEGSWVSEWTNEKPLVCFNNSLHNINLNSQRIKNKGSLKNSSVRIENDQLIVGNIKFLDQPQIIEDNNKIYKKNGKLFLGSKKVSTDYLDLGYINKSTKNKTYTKVYEFLYSGSISSIKLTSNSDKGDDYSIRIFNLTENKVIAEGTFSNKDKQLHTLNVINSITNTDIVNDIEIQLKSLKNKHVYIYSVLIYY